jgi:hypothetical protein
VTTLQRALLTVGEADANLWRINFMLISYRTDNTTKGRHDEGQMGVSRQTHLRIELKTSIGRKHHDRWRTEWIFRRQEYAEMIQSTLEFGPRRSSKCAMPFLKERSNSVRSHNVKLRSGRRCSAKHTKMSSYTRVVQRSVCCSITRKPS